MPPKKPAEKSVEKIGFFKKIPLSIYSPEFFARVANEPFGKAFSYFLGLMLVWMILFFSIPGMYLVTHRAEVSATIDELLDIFPEELVVSIEGGTLTTNVEEPYFIAAPEFTEEEGRIDYSGEWDIENFVVIDTVTPFTVNQMKDYKTLAWLTSDSLIVRSNSSDVEITSLAEAPYLTLDKAFVDEGLQGIWDGAKKMIVIFGLMMFLMMWAIFVVVEMIYLLLWALVILLVSSVLKLKLDYGQCYKIGMHAITLGLFIEIGLLLTAEWTGYGGFSYLSTLILTLVVAMNLSHAKDQKLLK
jgi:hypothetical protein